MEERKTDNNPSDSGIFNATLFRCNFFIIFNYIGKVDIKEQYLITILSWRKSFGKKLISAKF